MIHIYCKVITTVGLANTSITLYHFFFGVGTFKDYYLSNIQVYNAVLLTILTMLYIRSPNLSFYSYLYWSINDLQCCVSLYWRTKWISYMYTYIPKSPPSWASLPPSLFHLSRSSQSTELPCVMQQLLISYPSYI